MQHFLAPHCHMLLIFDEVVEISTIKLHIGSVFQVTSFSPILNLFSLLFYCALRP
jgi:hypothetical protein